MGDLRVKFLPGTGLRGMRVTVTPESFTERAAVLTRRIPVPLVQTLQAALLARAIMVATRVELFEALARGPASSEELARRCDCHPSALGLLLEALVGSEYVARHEAGYALGEVARDWLLASSRRSVRDKVLFQFVEWRVMDGFEGFVRDGKPSPMHDQMGAADWEDYQRAMRSFAKARGPRVVATAPVPRTPRELLDLGGGHGAISAAFCRRYSKLKGTVLDLPDAVAAAAPLLAAEGLGSRLVHCPGDARTADLGASAWDIVYVGQLTHHLSAAERPVRRGGQRLGRVAPAADAVLDRRRRTSVF